MPPEPADNDSFTVAGGPPYPGPAPQAAPVPGPPDPGSPVPFGSPAQFDLSGQPGQVGPDDGAPPTGGWTPPVDDPLFGPMPTYATGAYPLAGQQQGGYPVAAYPPAGPRADQVAAGWPGAEPSSGGIRIGPPTGGQPVAGGAGPEETKGYSFHLRAATSPLPTLPERPAAPDSATTADLSPAASRPAGPESEHPTGPLAIPAATPYPEDEPRPRSRTAGADGGGEASVADGRGEASGRARPARLQVALSRQRAAQDAQYDQHGPNARDDEDEPEEPSEAAGRFRIPAEYAPTRRRPRALVAVATAVVLTLVAVVAVAMLTRGDTSATEDPRPATPTVDPNFINSASSDSRPVGSNEFFPDKEVTVQGRTYTRIAGTVVDGCPDLSGELTTALKDGRCTQLVRAMYLSTPAAGEKQVLAGMSVFVLDEQSTAQSAATIAAERRGGVAPVPIPEGSVRDARITGPNGDNSWRAAIASGHYMILTQLAYVDGSQGAADDVALRSAITDLGLIAKEPIAQRMVTGSAGSSGAGSSSGAGGTAPTGTVSPAPAPAAGASTR
ncbi:hypothetical protein Ga0074812_102345 [Parafrankia irregularis]|uniref:Uncharacterized protein n=1 Tax=Parafrankia irregularis TaxID=795642 RepID=A0A0S4QGL2_9ACTN|nr:MULTISPECIES: hypothetical protein [Parafrankia]MBE3203029.1 hypothetical protein [Parafrankia sp. CH37]CUU54335.1 hypothetical protein Ga0074812_102345 [Parafrankia irregularis]